MAESVTGKDSLTCNGIVIYQYDFTTKDGKNLKFAKLLVSVKGMPVYINSSRHTEKKLFSDVIVDVYFNGKDWKLK